MDMKAKNQLKITKTFTKITIILFLFSVHLEGADTIKKVHPDNSIVEKAHSMSYTPIIDLLQDGESYTIQTTSLGCFHSCKETFEISREADVYRVQCGEITRDLTAEKVDEIRGFEMKLRSLSGGLCTTKDTYILTYGSTEIRVTDDSCMFNGVHKLMRMLGCEIPHDN